MGLGNLLSVLVLSSFILSCGKETDFLYRITDKPVETFETVHPLKQIHGQRKVDILWVVDNSASMQPHQKSLIKNIDMFVKLFMTKGNLEWRMGLISTTLKQEPLVGMAPSDILDYKTPKAIQRFQAAVNMLGLSGDGTERSFDPIRLHLSNHKSFLRPDATLAIIFISDAPEQSEIAPKVLLSYLRSKKGGDANKVVAYGALVPTEFACPEVMEDKWAYKGSRFEEFIGPSTGKVYPLCRDFGKNLADLGKDLLTRVDRPFIQLKERPDTSSIRVRYKGDELIGGTSADGGYWTYDFDKNRIVFNSLDFAPGDTEEVTISYSK